MSTTVDERVVSMQFDNKQFEQNVKTSMSTIEKLKQSLKFKNAGEGFKNIETSAKRVDMKGFGSSVEAVTAKFSALQVMGVTALANITNSVVNASKKMVSAITIDPVKSGFQEYETQMNAVQTILANTQKEGTNVKIVNKYLDELNTYADKTIYNFTEMTRNIGTFTAAGVELETSVSSIKGIANLAAVSGSTSQQASTAMYQLSQAIASGTVKLMDWNSVVNAGMGGQVFQDALVRTSEHLKTGAKAAISAEGSFRESLSTGWLTTEVLTQTLDQFATAADTQEEYEDAVKKFVEQGYTQEEAKQMADMAKTAGEAATKVKTFTQLIDTLKEALGSGWTKTWQLIIGDFEEARSLWTSVSDVASEFINKMSDARNKLLESALGKGFTSIADKITKITEPAKKASETIDKTVDAVSDLGNIVDDVILGKFGNGEDRFNALTEAGQNYYKIQNKVNETLGNSFRYTDEQIEAQDKLLGSQEKTTESTKEESEETLKLTDEKKELIKRIASMTEEQMREKGYTDEQIEAFKELGDTAKKLGIPLNEFIDNMDKINGRWLLLNSFKNIGKSIANVFKSIGKAWKEIFTPMTDDEQTNALFNIIAAFHKFTATIKRFTEDNADNLIRTFKGIFAILDLVTSVIGGGFKLAIQSVSYVLSYFNLNILDVTAAIGDALVWFRDWVKENNIFVKAIKSILPYLKEAAEGIRDWVEGIKDADNIPQYIIQGLINGLKYGINGVVSAVIELGKSLLNAIKDVLGIHSPSTEFFDIGKNIIQGLLNGLSDGLSSVTDFVKNIGSKLVEILKKIDFGAVFAVGIGIGTLVIINKLANALEILAGPIEGVSKVLSSVAGVFDAISDKIKSKILIDKSKAILNMAIAVGILAASVYALAQLDTGKLWATIGAIAVLSGIILALSFASSKMSSIGDFGKPSKALVSVAASLLILAYAMKKLSTIKGEDIPKTIAALTAMIVGLSVVLLVFGKFVKGPASMNMDKAGVMLLKISAALYVMVKVVKMAGNLDPEVMTKGLLFIGALDLFVMALVSTSKLAGEHASKSGSMLLKISIALGIMVGVVKLAGNLDPEVMTKGLLFVGALELFVISLVAVSKLAGQYAGKAGSMLLKISIALGIMVGVIKLAGKLTTEELIKGTAVVAVLETFMIALIAVSKLAGQHAAKAGAMLLEMAGSLLMITGVLYLLGKMDTTDTARALGIVTVLEILFGGLIAVTKLAQNCKGTIITLTVCIAILISAVSALTLLNQDKLTSATESISMIIGSFAALVAATGTLKNAKQVVKTLLPLVGIMAAIAAVLSVMSMLNVEPSIQTASAISVLLTSMSTAMLILSQASYVSKNNIKTLAIMGAVVAELAIILGIMDVLNVEPSIQTATALSIMLLAMSGALLIIGVVGTHCTGAMAGIQSLVILITALGTMMAGLGALNELCNGDLARFVNESIPILQDFGEGLGNFIGGFVGGIVAGALDSLSGIGTSLSDFMTELQPFINSVSTIDPSAMEGGKALADMILALTAANVLDGLAKFLGAKDLSKFGEQLVPFGEAMVDFSNTVTGNISEEGVTAAANAGKMMAELQQAIAPVNGWLQSVTGEKDLGDFGEQLKAFGTGIVAFSKTVSEGGGINESAVETAKNAGLMMTELQQAIEPMDGWLQRFTGDKDLGKFGEQLTAFGEAIVSFSETVSAEGAINETAIQAAANAGSVMAELQTQIEPTGVVIDFFAGSKDLGKFGEQIKSFGESIVAFSNTIEEGGIDAGSAESAKNFGMILIELQKAIPEKKAFDGKVTLDKFGKKIEKFGGSIKAYSNKVDGINVEAVTASVEAGKGIVKIAEMLKTVDSDSIGEFNFSLLGENLKCYYETIKDVDPLYVSSSVTSMSKLVKLIKSMVGIDTSGVNSFKAAINSLSKTNIGDLAKNFKESSSQLSSVGTNIVTAIKNGITSKQNSLTSSASSMMNKLKSEIISKAPIFTDAGSLIITKFATAIESQSTKVASSFTSMLSGSISKVRDYYDNLYSAGKYLVIGFASGISANTFRAEAKAKAMADAAYEAAKKALDINSPSKVFRRLAYFVPEGFAQGIDRRTGMAVNSSKDMANAAIDATKKTLSSLGSIVLSDIDSKPTIRPVLDLSDVNSGISTMNGMFGMRPSVGVISNLGSISSMMSNRQNGVNGDVVSAINDLKKSLGNTGNTSYTINGITYDDGSNIAEAMKSIVRAARVERRI